MTSPDHARRLLGMLNFRDQVAVVTGGARGIGKATAIQLLGGGARVVAVDVDEVAGAAALTAFSGGDRVRFFSLDVADTDRHQQLMRFTLQQFGRLDVLVNAAGVSRRQQLAQVTSSDWDAQVGINSRGAFFLMQAAALVMRDHAGCAVVNVASISALGYRKTASPAYAASKGAVVSMTRAAANDLAPRGIRVNCVCPGPTKSDVVTERMSATARERGMSADDLWRPFEAEIPLGRANQASEVAWAICFLASRAAGTVTGQTLSVDGGLIPS